MDATGGEGPDLHGVPASLGDEAVVNIIKHGIRGTAMPMFFDLSDKEAADIIAFLRSFDASATAGTVKGDPKAGKALYESSGCSACHMIEGQGGSVGPELTRIGAMRGPTSLEDRLIDPGANLPQNGTGFYSSKWTEYLMFRAVEKNGHVIEGMRVGEDSFVIVLKDGSGKFHALWRPDLRSLAQEPGKSLMPSFKSALSPAQMDALRRSEGAEFDRLFLLGMIQHHEGALLMVDDLFATAGAGQDAELFNFATDVDSGQRAEIKAMRTLLGENP